MTACEKLKARALLNEHQGQEAGSQHTSEILNRSILNKAADLDIYDLGI